MSALTTLLRGEIRENRLSLLVAPCVNVAVLGAVHALLPLDYAVSQAAASCVGILVALWTVYFAADLFASDCASGRMRTKSLLPIGALEIWRAKAVFYALAVGGLATWTIGVEYALQATFGSAESLAYFTDALSSIAVHAPLLALVAASTILCSLVMDSALVALLCGGLMGALFAGAGVALSRGLALAGIAWGPGESCAANILGAALLLVLGAVAFARGQARFGSRGVRLRVVVSTLAVVLLVGGIAGASEFHRRLFGSLTDPLATFETASASPDGRWLAIEVVGRSRSGGSQGSGTRSVWVVDLATRERELVVWPGCLKRDGQNGCTLPWDDPTSFRAEVLSLEEMRNTDTVVRVTLRDDVWQTAVCDPGAWDESRIAPAWAETSREKRGTDGEYVLRVRWPARGIEREIVGDWSETRLGSGVLLSPVPGRVFQLRDSSLVRFDLDDEQAMTLATDVLSMWPSPGGSAVLVRDLQGKRALSLVDGRLLRELWSLGTRPTAVDWIEGEGDPHAVFLCELGPGGRNFVEDLDTGVRFEFGGDSSNLRVHRLADGTFVYVDRNSDIVVADSHGEPVGVLIDR